VGRYVVSIAAAELPLSISAVALHLRADEVIENSIIESWIRDAVETWEAYTGVLVAPQVIDMHLDRFPAEIKIAKAPISAITSITYTDGAGVSQVLASDTYQVDLYSHQPRIRPEYQHVWPVTREQMNAVRVRMTAGYSTAMVPHDILAALKLHVGHRYANREDVVIGTIATQLPNAWRVVADRYRRSWF
jgi:uncharacterized phiE125 gp8 family phage protein